jgi:hypothetical protein
MYNGNKSNWYFNIMSLKEFSRTDHFIPNSCRYFQYFDFIGWKKKNRLAVNHENFLKS